MARYPKDWFTIPDDLSIPKFLRRPYDPSAPSPQVHVTHHLSPQHTPRPDNLTEHDKLVIAAFLKQQEPKPPTPAAPPRPKSQRKEIRAKLVDMKVIAAKLDISAKDARAALRSLGMVKGEAGWVFLQSEVDTIADLIRTTLAGTPPTPAKAVRTPRAASKEESHGRKRRGKN